MKVALVVLALLVPFCLAICTDILPVPVVPNNAVACNPPTFPPNFTVPCTNNNNGQSYCCQNGTACDHLGGCLTCFAEPVFSFVNKIGTACCSNFSLDVLADVWGDPHFTGFDGKKFDFQGIPNKWFNLLSSSDIQLNAFFQRSCGKSAPTYVTEIGVQVKGSKISLVPHNSTLDGAEVACCKGWTPIPLKNGNLRHQWLNHFEVETNLFLIKFQRHVVPTPGENCIQGSFDLVFKLKAWPGNVHGVIGQTAHHSFAGKAPEVEGKPEDYVVSGAFANDFTFNRYFH